MNSPQYPFATLILMIFLKEFGRPLVNEEGTEHSLVPAKIQLKHYDFQPQEDCSNPNPNNQEIPTHISLPPIP